MPLVVTVVVEGGLDLTFQLLHWNGLFPRLAYGFFHGCLKKADCLTIDLGPQKIHDQYSHSSQLGGIDTPFRDTLRCIMNKNNKPRPGEAGRRSKPRGATSRSQDTQASRTLSKGLPPGELTTDANPLVTVVGWFEIGEGTHKIYPLWQIIYVYIPGKPKTQNFLVILGKCRNDQFFW